MPPEEDEALRGLLEEAPLSWAIIGLGGPGGSAGTVLLASREFTETTGLKAESPAPAWLPAGVTDRREVELGERHFSAWTRPLGAARLIGLTDRSEIAQMEEQIWQQQTRLSKAYSEVSVRAQALSATLEKLRERETELEALNRVLEEKVSEQVRQLESSHKLRRYFSPEVAESIVSADASAFVTRKRVVTILFADLSSFDELVTEMESEEIIELLNEYHREMIGILFEHGGTLDKFIAARIMAFFGDPVPHEDHAARAVQTAIDMRERLRTKRPKWFSGGECADMQIGIHTGYATVGNIGCEQRMDYTVIGKNVAVAAALQQEAEPGQVLLSARTQEAVKDLFDLQSLKATLKGSSRPITVYNARAKSKTREESNPALEATTMLKTDKPVAVAGAEQRFGIYVVSEKLGEGGMGVVYKAVDERLQRPVALKVLASELAADGKFVARFKREARALACLNSPHIAQIYYVSDEEIPPFFAMEYVEGPTLRRVLADLGKLPLRRSLDLASQMAQGLRVAAEHGVIHRDVKPDNVILTLKGQVKLTDFGLAKGGGGDSSLTSRGIVMGTPLYMSPEQTRGDEVDVRSDIYSLGATFFHMLAGVPPFRGDTSIVVMRKHEEAPLPGLAELPSTISATVYQIVQRMMEKKREDRYPNYDALLEALDAC